jgi:hypothetical protein
MRITSLIAVMALTSLPSVSFVNARPQWTVEQANQWWAKSGWFAGCNFIPSTAVNVLEMWQEKTFDL